MAHGGHRQVLTRCKSIAEDIIAIKSVRMVDVAQQVFLFWIRPNTSLQFHRAGEIGHEIIEKVFGNNADRDWKVNGLLRCGNAHGKMIQHAKAVICQDCAGSLA